MEIGMVWSLAPTVDSVQDDHKVLQGWSLAETVDLTEGDDFETADLAKDEDLHSDEADFVEDHSNEDFIPVGYSKAEFAMESSSALQPEYTLRKHRVCNMNEKMLLKKILKSNLKTSGNLKTKPKERFKCTICKKAFHHEGFLRKHKQQHTRKFECKFCQKTFSGKAYLAQHEKKHTDEKIHAKLPSSSNVFKDIVSSEKFGSEDDLTLLELKQKIHEKKSLECRYCKKAFSSKDSLTQHELTHNFHKKEYRCNFCKKAFSLKDEVAVHELTHLDTGDEKTSHELTSARSLVAKRTKYRPFRCKRPGCKKSFAQRYNLKHHELTHTRVWQYQCSYCEKAFKWKGVMKIHEKNHKRAKPLPVFECSLCHMEFVYKSVYEKHVCKVQI